MLIIDFLVSRRLGLDIWGKAGYDLFIKKFREEVHSAHSGSFCQNFHTLAGTAVLKESSLPDRFQKERMDMKARIAVFPEKGRRFRRRLKAYFGNRKVKDRLFCYIFERDRKALLQLYNALNGTDYQDESALRIVTLKNVVYMSMNNDVAVIIMDSLDLYEHQSTDCPNMPLRFLLYIAAEYEAFVEGRDENIYGKKLVRLPAPRCVVFYNGDEEYPDEQILCLTDAFTDMRGRKQESCLELTVRVLNINYGHNKELVQCCRRLEEYALFIAKIKEFQQRGFPMEDAVDSAAAYCVKNGIMTDILRPFRAEVKKMLLTEYDEKKTRRLLWREAKEEGKLEGKEEGIKEGQGRIIAAMLQNGVSADRISEMTGISFQEVERIRKFGK